MLAVQICGDAAPDAVCDGAVGPVVIAPGNVSSGAWGLQYSAGVGTAACSGSLGYSPLSYPPAVGAGVQLLGFGGDPNACVAPSAVVYGVGGLTPPFDFSQLDAGTLTSAFAAGFVIVGMCWALGKAVGMLMSVVKR